MSSITDLEARIGAPFRHGKPTRRWIRTRPCKCGECRYKPAHIKCPLVGPDTRLKWSDYLWRTESRGGLGE